MLKNKIFAGIVASVIGFNCMLCPPQTEAASREEIAAINVVKADDFKYWSEDSSTRQKIVRFVEEATNPASKNFIPPANRIATFDMDGTFYCETAPLYFQEVMFLHRALEDKKYSPDRKMAAFAKKIKPKILNKTGITASENKKLFDQGVCRHDARRVPCLCAGIHADKRDRPYQFKARRSILPAYGGDHFVPGQQRLCCVD